jgi:hypothetical protein
MIVYIKQKKENKKMKRRGLSYNGLKLIIGLVFVVIIVGIIGLTVATSFNDHKFTITVTDKERVNSDDSSKYLIFGDSKTEEGLVFENTDALLRGKFNSSNIYSKLKVGNTYEITVVGYRVPFLSWYENIIDIQEVNK